VPTDQLSQVPIPVGTETWKPVPHAQVIELVRNGVEQMGWTFDNTESPFQVAISRNGKKMFGVTRIKDLSSDEDYGFALGFRNSHDKTLPLQFISGSCVFICDNLAFTGGVAIGHRHTKHLDPSELVMQALADVSNLFVRTSTMYSALREKRIDYSDGVVFLTRAVEADALPKQRFRFAKESYEKAYLGDQTSIKHGETLWAPYQAITSQWKHMSMLQMPRRNDALLGLVGETLGGLPWAELAPLESTAVPQ